MRGVWVRTGQQVRAGDPLVELDSTQEQSEVERLSRQFEAHLIRYLRDPSDTEARGLLTSLRSDRSSAEERVADRTLRAPIDATAAEVRVLAGQHLEAGEQLVTLVRGGARPELHGFLPAGTAPRLERGQRARVRLDGFAGAFVDVEVDVVGEGAMPPVEAQRQLGSGDELTGPVVSIRAKLPDEFTDEGKTYAFAHGQVGELFVETRRQRILLALIPWLKEVAR